MIKTHLLPGRERLLPHWPNPLETERRPWKPAPGEPICARSPEQEESEEAEETGSKGERKPPYHSEDDLLAIVDPYGSSVYSHYLQAMIASENAEIAKYNQQKTLFDSAYQEFCDYFNRTYMPAGPRSGNRVKF